VGSDNNLIQDTTLSVDPASNYLGINQTSPEVTLHMTGEGAQTAQIRMEQYNDSADAPDVRTRRYRGTIASPSAVQSGDYLYRSNHEYWNGSALIVGGQFAFDNTNNANRTQFTVAVTTDGTSVEASSNDDVQLKIDGNDGGAITFNDAYKFPTSDGSADQVLTTDGNGTLSFTTVNANPDGSNTQVQFNNAGSFGASTGFTFDDSDDTLSTGITRSISFEQFTDYDIIANTSAIASDLGSITTGAGAKIDQGLIVTDYGLPVLPSYDVASLPSGQPVGTFVFCPDEAGGPTIVFYDGSNWRRPSDNGIVS
jgi:hypothetical protein